MERSMLGCKKKDTADIQQLTKFKDIIDRVNSSKRQWEDRVARRQVDR